MYPIALLNDPPRPTYPEYEAVEAAARSITPAFVNPANIHPESGVVARRGADWCTAVLGRPYGWSTRTTVHEQYLLIAADRLDVDPALPEWIVEGRRAGEERERRITEQRAAQRQRERDRWDQVRVDVSVDLVVHTNTRTRVRGNLADALGHAVPTTAVHSGTRKVREHPPGRALCESPTRSKVLSISDQPEPDGTPVTCLRCLEWAPKVRAPAPRSI